MRSAFVLLLLAGCSTAVAPDAGTDDAAPVDALASTDAGAMDTGADAAVADAPIGCPVSGIDDATYGLANGAFPTDGHPDAAVHVPDGFDPCRPHGLVVWFHGFRNCVANVLGATPTECTPGAGTRTAFSLSDQMDAAGVNAILVAVEARYDESSGDPGALSEDGRLHALLGELYGDHLAPLLGRTISVDDASHVILASHSGGYVAVARSLEVGGVRVDEIELFDSLYGEIAVYEAWLETNLLAFDPAAPTPLRFAMVYTDGGTDASSRALALRVQADLTARGDPANLLYDDTTATLDEPTFRVPILVKHSALSHDGVVGYYFERMLRGSDLPRLP